MTEAFEQSPGGVYVKSEGGVRRRGAEAGLPEGCFIGPCSLYFDSAFTNLDVADCAVIRWRKVDNGDGTWDIEPDFGTTSEFTSGGTTPRFFAGTWVLHWRDVLDVNHTVSWSISFADRAAFDLCAGGTWPDPVIATPRWDQNHILFGVGAPPFADEPKELHAAQTTQGRWVDFQSAPPTVTV